MSLSMCVSVCFAGGRCVYVFQQWYTATMNLLGTWLTERMDQQLHVYQLKILIRITKVRTGSACPVGRMPRILCRHTVTSSHCPPAEKVPGLSPAGRPRLNPQQQDVWHGAQPADCGGGHCFSEGRRHAGHLHEGQRRGGRRGWLEPVHWHSDLSSLPPLNPHTPTPFHTFDFSLVTDACTNSDSHSRTSLSARNAYEGTINYKNSTYTEENQNKKVKK